MSEPMTMTEAGTTNNGNPSSMMSGSAAATAEALYGNTQQAPKAQEQQAAESAKAVESKGDQSAKPEAVTQGDNPADTKPAGAPEKYEFKPYEGREFDPEVVNAFSGIAKELNLTQEAAQKVLDTMAPKMAERQMAQMEAIRSQWTEASKSDREFGGDKITENLAVAKKALDSFGTPELRTLLNESGLGNHPEVIRFMFRAGRAISEDRYVGSSAGAAPGKGMPKDFNAAASALYSSQS